MSVPAIHSRGDEEPPVVERERPGNHRGVILSLLVSLSLPAAPLL